jgi:hypothetical protein
VSVRVMLSFTDAQPDERIVRGFERQLDRLRRLYLPHDRAAASARGARPGPERAQALSPATTSA